MVDRWPVLKKEGYGDSKRRVKDRQIEILAAGTMRVPNIKSDGYFMIILYDQININKRLTIIN